LTTTDPARPVCSCRPGFYSLGCDVHWDLVGAALVKHVNAALWPPERLANPTSNTKP
jgi:hypothetical protein